jgi:hypothetical protein
MRLKPTLGRTSEAEEQRRQPLIIKNVGGERWFPGMYVLRREYDFQETIREKEKQC